MLKKFSYYLNYSAADRIKQYECLQGLFELIYPDGNFRKNSFNRFYNLGHLGHLYHQVGNDDEALKYLDEAAMYAVKLDKSPDTTERAKRFYNFGTAYREMSVSQFMKTVMTEHYPLTEAFKENDKFKEIIDMLSEK